MVPSMIGVATFGALLGDFSCFRFFLGIRFSFFYDFGFLLGAKMAPKINLGGAWAQKGRPLILNKPPMKKQLFCLRGCPGTPKIAIIITLKNPLDFVLTFIVKMASLGFTFGIFFVTKTAREIDPGNFFNGCSPQSLPKPPDPAPRTPPGSAKSSPGTLQVLPRTFRCSSRTPPSVPNASPGSAGTTYGAQGDPQNS